ncbi:ABC transporter substrate-binding protein [Sphingobium aromaticiconvertens]|uniref:ABC transporter substrate-binding protein n=1 Tax=Sphingobium aromaticiconvertens TaxID=365341 RepID=UPI00301731B6
MPYRSYRSFVKIIAVFAAIASLGAVAQAGEGRRPQRIVSLNLCADQYLIALADPGQIAGLTHNATDPAMSAGAARARGLPIMGQSAEEILAINPDLIIGAPARRSGVMAALNGRDYRMVDLKSAENYGDIIAQIRQVAAAIGQGPRGEAMIARMNRELTALPRLPGKPVAAYYQRRGYMTGTGTLVDDLMRRVGLTNLAGKLGKPSLSQLSLEEMIMANPDYLVVESATDRITDQGTEMLHHPILDGIPRLRVPQAWTVCGGPAYVLAARSLSQQIQQTQARTGTGAKRINAR